MFRHVIQSAAPWFRLARFAHGGREPVATSIGRRLARNTTFTQRRRPIAALLACGMLATSPWAAAQALAPNAPPIKQPGQFPTVQLSVGLNVIHAEVAANEADREQGLMYRTGLAPNAGMLFVFDDRAGHCFWMKNTLIPLSIAFIADDGTVTDVEEMAAETEDNHCPTRPIRYALEMEKGWFAAHGVVPGAQFQGLNHP